MHNWLEGVLQHHLHILWCIGFPEEVKKVTVKLEKDEQWSQADSHESAEELEGLQKEVEEANEQADMEARTMQSSPMLSTRSNITPTQDDPQLNPYAFMDIDNGDNDEMIDSNSNFVPLNSETFTFSNSELAAICDLHFQYFTSYMGRTTPKQSWEQISQEAQGP